MSIAIKRSFTVPTTSALNAADLFLTSSTASTSPTSGSLQVLGGVGISGAISLAGPLRLYNANYYTGFDSAATANTTYIWPATSPSTGTSVLSSDTAGNLSWVLMSASGSGLTLNGLSGSTQYFATSFSGSGFTIGSIGSTHTFYIGLASSASTGLISNVSQTIFGTKTFASGVAITSGLASTSTNTGDLTVAGGVGIGGSLFTQTLTVGSGVTGLIIQKMVGANYVAMYSTNVTPSGTNYTFITDGQSPNFNGTFGVYFNISNSNKVQITNTNINITPTTSSTSSSTGSLTVAGGVGVGGSLWTGLSNFSSISGVGHLNGSITSGVWAGTAISAVNGGTGLFSFTTGDILYASSSSTISRISAGIAGSVLTSAGAGTTPYWSLAASTGVTTINGLTSSIQYYSTGIGGSSFNISSSGSTHTFNIPLAGAGITGLISPDSQTIAGDKTFLGNIAVSGNLTVNGTTTTVNSTITTVVDPVITIGASIGGTNPSIDDNKDRGIEFKYYSGTAKTGFFGFDDSTGYFTFIPDASNSSEVFSGTTGVLDVTRITGSSASWTNSRTVTFAGGGVTGSFSIDGSSNVSFVSLNVDNDAVALGTKTTGQYSSTISISGSGITATSANASDGTAYTIYSSAVSTNTASSIVLRDGSGNFSAGTITANTFSGNATTSTSAGLAGTAINAGAAFTSTNAGLAYTSTFSGSAFTATNAGSAGTSITAGFAGTAINAGSATTSTSAGTAGTATNAGSAGTSVSAGTAGTATNAGSAGTSISAGTAGTATNAGSAGTSTSAGTAGTATNAANTNIILDTTSTIYLTGSRSNVSIGNTPRYVLSGVSALGNTITATTFSGNATTSTNSGLAGTSVNAGSAGTSIFSGSAGTAINAGSAGTSIFSGSAGTSINAGSAGTSISSGLAGTSINSGSAATSINSANTNIILDTASTIYLTGSRSNASIGSTPVYVLSGVSALGNTITATTFSGSLSGTASSTALINTTASNATRFLATVISNSASGSTQIFTGSGITVGDNRLTAGGIAVTSGVISTSTTTGALTVFGGVGITGQLSINTLALGNTGVSVTPSMIFTGTAGTVISMSVLSDTTLAWEGSSGQLFSIDNNLSSGEIFSVSDISGLPIISASAGQSIYLNEFGGFTQVGNGLASTNTNTGALRVVGGVGITGAAYIAGNTSVSSSTASTSTTTGALVVTGGVGVGSSVNIAGNTTISSSTLSTSSTTGALVVTGGAGIGGTLNIGGHIRTGSNTFSKSGFATGDILLDNGSVDTPGLLFYWGNNRNIGLDTFYSGTGTTRFRIVRELNESGGFELWSVDRNGYVTQTAWAPGEIIKTTVLVGSELTGSNPTTINSASDTDVASYSYTPISSNSYILIEFQTRYTIAGAAEDNFISRIAVDGAEQSYGQQYWINGAGGGTRSGVLFPLMARYTNSNITAKTISVTVRRGVSDDNATVNKDSTTVMKITEIGR
jgi:hypothetical protein